MMPRIPPQEGWRQEGSAAFGSEGSWAGAALLLVGPAARMRPARPAASRSRPDGAALRRAGMRGPVDGRSAGGPRSGATGYAAPPLRLGEAEGRIRAMVAARPFLLLRMDAWSIIERHFLMVEHYQRHGLGCDQDVTAFHALGASAAHPPLVQFDHPSRLADSDDLCGTP